MRKLKHTAKDESCLTCIEFKDVCVREREG